MTTFKTLANTAFQMVQDDKSRDLMFQKVDQIIRCEWELPRPLDKLDHVRKVVVTDGLDAVMAGTRTLSSLEPGISLQVIGEDQAAKDRANRIEKSLRWHLMNASKRRRASIVRDVVMSSLKYDEVCAQVLFLPDQIKQMKGLEKDVKRLKVAERFGPYSVILHNPRLVHTRYSNLMPEAVLLAAVYRIDEVIDMWGVKAKELVAKKADDAHKYVTLYDYIDLNERAVWAFPSNDAVFANANEGKAVMILEPQEHDLPFLPWACRVGGTTLEASSQHQRIPILYSVVQSGQYDTQNAMETILVSEAIAYGAAPRLHIQGPNPDAVEVDYGDVNKPIETNQFTNVTQLAPPQIDAGLLTLSERISQAMGKSTVSRILQGGEIPAGTAYATLNLATLTAIGALKPYKELAELAVADILTLMMLWVDHSGETVKAYGGKEGKAYEITPEDVQPESLYITVELKPDVPSDRQQRINGASMAVERLGMSKEEALEEIGITDPQGSMRKAMFEKFFDYQLQRFITQDQMQMQIMAQQAMQPQGQAPQQPAPGTPPGFPGVGGQGVNPEQGGAPPAEFVPGGTREAQTGMASGGEEAQGL
jgi:hypothetical protein